MLIVSAFLVLLFLTSPPHSSLLPTPITLAHTVLLQRRPKTTSCSRLPHSHPHLDFVLVYNCFVPAFVLVFCFCFFHRQGHSCIWVWAQHGKLASFRYFPALLRQSLLSRPSSAHHWRSQAHPTLLRSFVGDLFICSWMLTQAHPTVVSFRWTSSRSC